MIKDLMRPSVKDDWGIKELQNCILNIMKYIHEFCEDNNIEYYLMGGSALGAIRHQGFIPWDDDLDIFMTPDNFRRFSELFSQKGDKTTFYLQELGKSGKWVSWAKLRMNNTEFIEEAVSDLDIHHGIYVDIMIMEKLPNSFWARKWKVFWCKYLEIKGLSLRKYTKRGKLVYSLLYTLRLLPPRFLLDYAQEQRFRYESKECDNYFHLYISAPIEHSVYPKRIFKTSRLVNFETIQLRIPAGTDEYLKILFGDYMKVPDIDYIRFHQHAHKWSTTHSFKKRGKGSFSDEKYLF